MPQLIRLDSSGHTTVAEWTADDPAAYEAACSAFALELAAGHFAIASYPDGAAEQVRELPRDVPMVILRRPIAGG
jgi:hypothetical protein